MPRLWMNGMDYLQGHPDPAEEPHFEATEYCHICHKPTAGYLGSEYFYGNTLDTELGMDHRCKCEEEE